MADGTWFVIAPHNEAPNAATHRGIRPCDIAENPSSSKVYVARGEKY